MYTTEQNRKQSRIYARATQALKKKYEKEYYEYRETKAWGTTYKQRHDSTIRHLRFKHPIVFKRLYKSFLEQELG